MWAEKITNAKPAIIKIDAEDFNNSGWVFNSGNKNPSKKIIGIVTTKSKKPITLNLFGKSVSDFIM